MFLLSITMMIVSQRDMTVFLAESRERTSQDPISYGSLIDDESQKMKKTVFLLLQSCIPS